MIGTDISHRMGLRMTTYQPKYITIYILGGDAKHEQNYDVSKSLESLKYR